MLIFVQVESLFCASHNGYVVVHVQNRLRDELSSTLVMNHPVLLNQSSNARSKRQNGMHVFMSVRRRKAAVGKGKRWEEYINIRQNRVIKHKTIGSIHNFSILARVVIVVTPMFRKWLYCSICLTICCAYAFESHRSP